MIGTDEGATGATANRRQSAVALLKDADRCLEVVHLRPTECQPIKLTQVAEIRDLLARIAGRVEEMRADLFGDQGE
ncbi:MAG TPA: hypothetical protein PLU30_27205 [Verrucomicrobiae bacterium]|nr:hypothetical protein [Verrucomicrobiae bacterium]